MAQANFEIKNFICLFIRVDAAKREGKKGCWEMK